jgi:DUF1365 family protein
MAAPRVVFTRIRHVRRVPIRRTFVYRSYSWLVDLDALPVFPRGVGPFARFVPRDHLGEPTASIRANVDRFLGEAGVDLRGGRVLMLTNARVLGYVFNPLTAFWCHDDRGVLVCVIAEVHNTYRGRHRYLLYPDRNGKCVADKTFPVSPFNPVDGHYRLQLPEPDHRLGLAITLCAADGTDVLTATMTGPVRPASTRTVLRALVTMPVAPLLVAARIRWQGIALWARGLPTVARMPTTAEMELQ